MSRRAQGLRAWAWQRLSAVYLAGFSIFVLYKFLFAAPLGYDTWRAWVLGPVVSISIILFFVMALVHAWVGLRDVIIDYVHGLAARGVCLALAGLALMVCGVWAVQVLVGAAT